MHTQNPLLVGHPQGVSGVTVVHHWLFGGVRLVFCQVPEGQSCAFFLSPFKSTGALAGPSSGISDGK